MVRAGRRLCRHFSGGWVKCGRNVFLCRSSPLQDQLRLRCLKVLWTQTTIDPSCGFSTSASGDVWIELTSQTWAFDLVHPTKVL